MVGSDVEGQEETCERRKEEKRRVSHGVIQLHISGA